MKLAPQAGFVAAGGGIDVRASECPIVRHDLKIYQIISLPYARIWFPVFEKFFICPKGPSNNG